MDREITIAKGLPVYKQIGTVEQLHGEGFHVNGQHYDRDQVARVTEQGIFLANNASARSEGAVPGIEIPAALHQTEERDGTTETARQRGAALDRRYHEARGEFEQAHTTRRTAATDDWGRNRTFEQAEPHYRSGYYAAHEERYARREFDEAEPDLRRDYEMNVTNQTYRTVGRSDENEVGEGHRVGATAGGGQAGTGGTGMPEDYAGDSDAVIGGGTQAPVNVHTRAADRAPQDERSLPVGETMQNGGDTWEQLREEIRQGWNRARGS